MGDTVYTEDGGNVFRPKSFEDYIGQKDLIEKLKVSIQAAKTREDPLPHTLLQSAPGLGKTTLANIIANEFGSGFVSLNAQALKKPGDIFEILFKLEKNDILFLDECQALDSKLQEFMYTAMEDFYVSIKIT